jgi:hypothetical protein
MKRLVLVLFIVSLILVPSVQAQDKVVEIFDAFGTDEMIEPGTSTIIGFKARWYGTEDIITSNLSIFVTGHLLLQYDNSTDFWTTEVVRNDSGNYHYGVVEVFHPEAINFLQTSPNITVSWGIASENQYGYIELGGFLAFLSVVEAVVFFLNKGRDED